MRPFQDVFIVAPLLVYGGFVNATICDQALFSVFAFGENKERPIAG